METYKNLKKGTKIGLIISFIFVILGIGWMVFNLISTPKLPALPEGSAIGSGAQGVGPASFVVPGWVKDAVYLVLYLLTAFYALFGYKKPHGNLLKFVFFVFAITLVLNGIGGVDTSVVSLIVATFACLSALLLTYVAGRLHKVEQNRFLLVVTGALLLVSQILPSFYIPFNFAPIGNALTPLIVLLTLGFAYTARYEEHKAAGLADKADAKEK